MQFPTGIRRGAVIPGRCAVSGCDNPEIVPQNGLCMVHNCLLADYVAWLDTRLDADSGTSGPGLITGVSDGSM